MSGVGCTWRAYDIPLCAPTGRWAPARGIASFCGMRFGVGRLDGYCPALSSALITGLSVFIRREECASDGDASSLTALDLYGLARHRPPMDSTEHWDKVYEQKGSSSVSWYRPHLQTSIALIESLGLARDAEIVDIGGGASTLVDDLLALGYCNITVVDLSQAALDIARTRLGELGASVRWVQGDVTTVDLGCKRFDVWHDRAVFHFLTERSHREAYVERACCSLRSGGHIVLATFAHDGPEKCSGLPVVRYSAEELESEFGSAYQVVAKTSEVHLTPWGTSQSFVYCLCNKVHEC